MRLADRRGLLQGASLSPVQAYAAEMMLILERRERVEGQVFDLRSRLAAANPSAASDIFPEWFVKEVKPAEDESKKDEEPAIEWSIPTSQEEVDDLDAWVREHQQMTVTGEDLTTWQ